MLPLTRQPVPRELTWEQTDGVIRDFYWLRDEHPTKGQELDVQCRDNVITVGAVNHPGPFAVLLDERLVDFNRPVQVRWHDKIAAYPVQPELRVLCQELVRRADPGLAASARLELSDDPGAGEKAR